MGRKRKNTNYRRYYSEYYGVQFDDSYAIHHIDFDRTNNNIDNLILLPKALHSKYHWYVSALGGAGSGFIDGDMRMSIGAHKFEDLRGLADTFEEVLDWIRVKHQMEMMKYSGLRWDDVVRR